MKIYLDTNVFDILTKNDYRREDTEILFSEIENNKYEAYYSPTVVDEIFRTSDEGQMCKLKKTLEEKVLQKRCVVPIRISSNELTKILKLVDAYTYISKKEINTSRGKRLIWTKSIFSKLGSQAEDRIHIATAVINRMDAFVTWNTREYIKRHDIKNWINEVNIKLGYSKIEFYSPTQVIKL